MTRTPSRIVTARAGLQAGLLLACIASCATPVAVRAADAVTLTPRIFPVGKWAEGITFGAGRSLWVAESGQRSIAELDPVSGQILQRIDVGRLPVGMAVGKDGTVAALVQTDKVVWQQPASQASGRVLAGLQGCPNGIAQGKKYIWVLTEPECSSVSSRLIRIDPPSGRASTGILPEWAQAVAVANQNVWIAHAKAPALTVVDENTLAARTVDIRGVSLWAISACCGEVYAGGRLDQNNAHGIVIAIDPSTLQEKRRALVDQRIVAIVGDDKNVIAIGEKGRIWVFSARGLELQRVVNLATGVTGPKAALLRGEELYVSIGQQRGENGAVLLLGGWRPVADAGQGQAMTTECPYAVTNVAPQDFLWMYQGPDTNVARVMGIPPNTRGITVDRCVKDWCHASFGGSAGWVQTRFIGAYCN